MASKPTAACWKNTVREPVTMTPVSACPVDMGRVSYPAFTPNIQLRSLFNQR